MTQDFAARFHALRDTLAAFYRARAAEGGPAAPMLAEVAEATAGLAAPEAPERPGRLPGCRHYAAAMAGARNGPLAAIAEAFDTLEPDMRWVQSTHYRATLGDDYMANYAYTQLAGTKDALAYHDRMATGSSSSAPAGTTPTTTTRPRRSTSPSAATPSGARTARRSPRANRAPRCTIRPGSATR